VRLVELKRGEMIKKIRFAAEVLAQSARWKPDLVVCAHVNYAPLGFLAKKLFGRRYMVCTHGIDVWEVIDAAATKPFGFMKFTPGPGLGGHCIPIDPLYLSWKLKSLNYTARFIELASEINTNMPRYVVDRVQEALNEHGKALNGSKVLVLGAAYKPDIDDLRESPSLDVIALLRQKKAQVSYHDPYIPHLDHEDWTLDSVADPLKAAKAADVVVVVTNHSNYDYPTLLKNSKLIVDTRNAFGQIGKGDPKVVKL